MRYRMTFSSGYKTFATYSWEEVLNFVEIYRKDKGAFDLGRVVRVEKA